MGKLFAVLAGSLLIGAPLVHFIWQEISEALYGRIHVGRLSLALALLIVVTGLLKWLGGYLLRLDEEEGGRPATMHSPYPRKSS